MTNPSAPSPRPTASQPNLPMARHAGRVPAHIEKEALSRIRHAAYTLPQVVKPADYLPEHAQGHDDHLDKLGFVLLQKAVAGQRPSRWIDPALMDAALAHIDAVGQGPEARSLMLQRAALLQGLGVARQAGTWTRLISHALRLGHADWRVPVIFRVPVAADLVWAFFGNTARGDGLAPAAPAGRRTGGTAGSAGSSQRRLQTLRLGEVSPDAQVLGHHRRVPREVALQQFGGGDRLAHESCDVRAGGQGCRGTKGVLVDHC